MGKLKRKQAPLKSTCSSVMSSNGDGPTQGKRYNGPIKIAKFEDDNIREASNSPTTEKIATRDVSQQQSYQDYKNMATMDTS